MAIGTRHQVQGFCIETMTNNLCTFVHIPYPFLLAQFKPFHTKLFPKPNRQ